MAAPARAVARQQLLDVPLEPGEERASRMSPYLMTSASPARNSRRQRPQRLGIGEHRARLMKRADEVLAAGMVDAGLAADGRVHLASSVVGTCT